MCPVSLLKSISADESWKPPTNCPSDYPVFSQLETRLRSWNPNQPEVPEGFVETLQVKAHHIYFGGGCTPGRRAKFIVDTYFVFAYSCRDPNFGQSVRCQSSNWDRCEAETDAAYAGRLPGAVTPVNILISYNRYEYHKMVHAATKHVSAVDPLAMN